MGYVKDLYNKYNKCGDQHGSVVKASTAGPSRPFYVYPNNPKKHGEFHTTSQGVLLKFTSSFSGMMVACNAATWQHRLGAVDKVLILDRVSLTGSDSSKIKEDDKRRLLTILQRDLRDPVGFSTPFHKNLKVVIPRENSFVFVYEEPPGPKKVQLHVSVAADEDEDEDEDEQSNDMPDHVSFTIHTPYVLHIIWVGLASFEITSANFLVVQYIVYRVDPLTDITQLFDEYLFQPALLNVSDLRACREDVSVSQSVVSIDSTMEIADHYFSSFWGTRFNLAYPDYYSGTHEGSFCSSEFPWDKRYQRMLVQDEVMNPDSYKLLTCSQLTASSSILGVYSRPFTSRAVVIDFKQDVIYIAQTKIKIGYLRSGAMTSTIFEAQKLTEEFHKVDELVEKHPKLWATTYEVCRIKDEKSKLLVPVTALDLDESNLGTISRLKTYKPSKNLPSL